MSLVGCWSVVEESLVLCIFSFFLKKNFKKRREKNFGLNFFLKKEQQLSCAWPSAARPGLATARTRPGAPAHCTGQAFQLCWSSSFFLVFWFF